MEVDPFRAPLAVRDEETRASLDKARRSSTADTSIVTQRSEGELKPNQWPIRKNGMRVLTGIHSTGFQADNVLASATQVLPSNAEQLAKHQAGEFEWILSIPTASRDSVTERRSLETAAGENSGSSHEGPKKLLFGCNLVHRKASSEGSVGKHRHGHTANVYTLLATRIEGDEESNSTDKAAAPELESMSMTQADTTVIRMTEPHNEEAAVRRSSAASFSAKDDDIVDHFLALPPTNRMSRIEDSVEALDKLEEELEALNEVARLERVFSPEALKSGAATQSIKEQASAHECANSASQKPATGTVRVRNADRSSSVRKSASTAFIGDEGKPANKAGKAARKSLVAKPANLVSLKSSAKSSKPPTLPTFELPGDAVARRLKEQREARLSRHMTPEQTAQTAQTAAALSPGKPHVKSIKAPTRPTFELPGEAISRRRREEREAKLRAQQEEERKRREFKARPVRASIAPSMHPRETIASRARQGKVTGLSAGGAESTAAGAATPAAAKKKHPMAVGGASAGHPTSRPLPSVMATRGCGRLAVGPPADGTSRAASRGSMHDGNSGSETSVGKRSTVSAEEVQQQKLRGREIFVRDNRLAAERERERREREAATKTARQAAAERSRQLSREWAEKHKLRSKRSSMIGSSAA